MIEEMAHLSVYITKLNSIANEVSKIKRVSQARKLVITHTVFEVASKIDAISTRSARRFNIIKANQPNSLFVRELESVFREAESFREALNSNFEKLKENKTGKQMYLKAHVLLKKSNNLRKYLREG